MSKKVGNVAEVAVTETAKVYKWNTQAELESRLAAMAREQDSHQGRLLAELIGGNSWDKDIVCQRARSTNGNLANLLSAINRGECSLLAKLRDAYNRAVERGDVHPDLKFPTLRQLDNKKRGRGGLSLGDL